jgi:thymidylate synthase
VYQPIDKVYADLCKEVLNEGNRRFSRAGDTISKFGTHLKYEGLQLGLFPLLTTRRIYYKGVLGELAGFLEGTDSVERFEELGCKYWRNNAEAWAGDGPESEYLSTGRIYGVQWRFWERPDGTRHDQIVELIRSIRNNPDGRRHLLTAWNPGELEDMCLPPCHIFAQFYTCDKHLDIHVYMRSVDLALGLPSDFVLYAALLVLVAKETGYYPGTMHWSFGDSHIYQNHEFDLRRQLTKEGLGAPTFSLDPETSLDGFMPEDLTINDYHPLGAIQYEFNV